MAKRGSVWRRYYIHEIQKEYAIMVVILLLVYTFILSLFLFGPPAIKLFADVPLPEKAEASTQVLVFADRLWPAVIVSFFLSTAISVYATHRVAGPIYRFEQTIKKLLLGDISVRIKLRENDRLVYLSNLINQMADNMSAAIGDVKKETVEMKEILDKIMPELGSQGHKDMLKSVEDIAEHRDRIEKMLAKFNVTQVKKAD